MRLFFTRIFSVFLAIFFVKSPLAFAVEIANYTVEGLVISGNNIHKDIEITNSGAIVVGANDYALSLTGSNGGSKFIIDNKGLLQSGGGLGVAIKVNGVENSVDLSLGAHGKSAGVVRGSIDAGNNDITIFVSSGYKNGTNNLGIFGNITTAGNLLLTAESGLIAGNIDATASNVANINIYENSYISGNILFSNTPSALQNIKLQNATIGGNISGLPSLLVQYSGTVIGNIGNNNLNAIKAIDVSGNGELNLVSNSQKIYSEEFYVFGTLNLASENINIFSNLSLADGSSINLNSGAHLVSGSLAIGQSAINTTIFDQNIAGKINVDGNLSLAPQTTLNVSIAKNFYARNNSSYTILSSNNLPTLNAISKDKININNSNSNKAGLIEFSTAIVDGNKLVLSAVFNQNAYKPSLALERNVFEAILNLDNPTEELLAANNYLITANVDNATRDKFLLNLSVNNIGVNQTTYSIANNVVNAIEGKVIENWQSPSVVRQNALWIKFLKSSSQQENKNEVIGYGAKSDGILFGGDIKIDKYTFIGAGLALSNANINVDGGNKKTSLASHQLNFYGSKNFGTYFLDAFVAAAFNKYNSRRSIPLLEKTATASYGGNTYLGKIKFSTIKKPANKVELLPEISLLLAQNSLDDYSENGAGTLNLNVKNNNSKMLEGTIGATLRYNSIELDDNKIFPKVKFLYGYDFSGNQQISTANFVGQKTVFTAQTSNLNRALSRFEVGLDWRKSNYLLVSANYILETKLGYSLRTSYLSLRYQF